MLTIDHGQEKRLSGLVIANDYVFLMRKLPIGAKVIVHRDRPAGNVYRLTELDCQYSGYFTRAPGTEDTDIIRKYFLKS